MPKEMKDLQNLINKRAANRLDRDIMELSKIRNNRLLKSEVPQTRFKYVDESLTKDSSDLEDLLYYSSPFMRRLKEQWLPIYIQEESESFLEKINELQSQVDDLLNHVE